MSDEPEPGPRVEPEGIDERVFLHGVTWEDYARLLEIRGDSSVPRMTYLEGELELMSPAWIHEERRTTLARVIEAWSEEMGVPLYGLGSWTLKRKRVKRGAEPDECYIVGKPAPEQLPDFAIEVVHTSGGLSKLEVYRKLGVREVWFFKRGRLAFHALRGDRYEAIGRSEVVPALDPALIERCMSESDQLAAVAAVRAAVRAGT